jgi:peptidylprolyl isomerase
MKLIRIFSFMLLSVAAAGAQTAPATAAKPATAKPAATAGKPATATAHTAAASTAPKLPPGVPVVKGIVKPAFALRYQDIAIGTGADAVPNKLYKVFYTGYLGLNGRPDDGYKFDSSADHRAPVMGKDGKPVLGDDGKPKLGDPQPMAFPQGTGRLIPGFDQGFEGMKVGGKRRLFIPWQLAYGATGRTGPDAAHPGIPPKADLIFDVELVDVADMPTAQPRPPVPSRPIGSAPPQPGSSAPATPAPPATTPAPATPPAPAAPATPAAPAQPAAPAAPPQPQSK